MNTAAIDPRMGASGDMLLGALIDAGGDPDALTPIEAALDVHVHLDAVDKQGIGATDVTIHHGEDGHHTGEGHGPHRTFEEVVDIVESMGLDSRVTHDAIAAFRLLGEAEADVHGTDIPDTHFHEVGADDAIADVTGTIALLDTLDIDRIVATPASTGSGEIESSHGIYPVPPPAVIEIASRSSLRLQGGPVEAELLTPTGAALLGSIADHVEQLPPMSVDAVGYGAGSRSFPSRPNVLRVVIGEAEGALAREDVSVLETHVDDATPEILGHLQQRLHDVGALDVSASPLTMKKSRPGHLVRVIVAPADEARVARVLAEETGTLGVRAIPSTHRWVATREFCTVTIEVDGRSFSVETKIGRDESGSLLDISAEYEDAARIASTTSLPVREVMRRAESVAARSIRPTPE